MRLGVIAVSAGIACVGFLPALPSVAGLFICSLLIIACCFYQRLIVIGLFCLGVLWAAGYGLLGIAQQLPASLEGEDLWVVGEVVGLPEATAKSQRFEFQVKHIDLPTDAGQTVRLKRVRINWYQSNQLVQPGEQWRLQLRLKRPHGFANPNGFDYQGWLFRQGIGATGYVRHSPDNQLLQVAGINHWLDQGRFALHLRLSHLLADNPAKGLLLALLMGERSSISAQQWDLLSATGTNHLFVISGLHIGFVALCAYFIVFNLSRWLLLGPPTIAAQQVGACAALLAGIMYAAMAGFALPTQRALIMLAVMLLGRLCRRRVSVWHSYSVALLLVLIWDPLAPQGAGFWLSFGAVGCLLYAFSQYTGNRSFWWRWVRPQYVVFIGFIPVLLFFFQQVSLVSPLANLLVIPFVGMVIVPQCLLAGVLLVLAGVVSHMAWLNPLLVVLESSAGLILVLAEHCLEIALSYLALLADLPWSSWSQSIGIGALLTSLAGVMLLLAPRGLPGRWLGLVCMLPLMVSSQQQLKPGDYRLTVLDVGQGLAVFIRTAHHQLIYDVGPRYSARFDASSAVILPFLRQQDITTLDMVIISHSDNDHAGSLPVLLQSMVVEEIVTGSPLTKTNERTLRACQTGRQWLWDDVIFELMQASAEYWNKTNNQSCLLKISNGQNSVLLTGDVEAAAEGSLIDQFGGQLKADIVLAPHHGSLTSSSDEFLEQVNPGYVIFSAGYRNRFGHPHSKVVSRYRDHGAMLLSTISSGAISVSSQPGRATPVIEQYRLTFKRYWY